MKRSQTLHQPSQFELQPIIQALNAGQLAQAELQAKKLLKHYPASFALYNLYGNALAGQGKNNDAVAVFRQALRINPDIAELHFNVAVLQGQLKRTEEAIKSYRKALALKPDLTDAHYNLAIALQAQEEYELAEQSYRKAIELEPHFHEAIVNLGAVLQEQGQLQQAIDMYQRALSIKVEAKMYFNIGTAYKNMGKLADAIDAYNEALKLEPHYADAHASMAEVLRDQGRYDESVTFFKQALAIDPTLPKANYSLAVYLYDSGRLEEALDYFRASQFADWEERMLYCLYKTERFEEFKRALDELKAVKHNSPFLATLAGHYAENFGVPNDYNFCPDPMRFVFHTEIKELKGEHSELRAALLKEIRSADVAEKMQGRLYNGVQSAGNLLKRPEPAFQELAKLVADAVERYRKHFAGEDCEFIRSFPKKTVIASSWYVRMKQGGHLTSHIHEEGWISGAIYLALPKQKSHEHEGSIEVSTHGDDYPKKHDNFQTRAIAPEVGDFIMFPSSLFHRTIPFSSDEERICIAFDLKP